MGIYLNLRIALQSNSLGAAEISGSLPRTAATFPTARDLQIVDSTLTVVGGDVINQHNHHYLYQRPRDIWAILQSIPNFRNIYLDMLSKPPQELACGLSTARSFASG